MDWLDPEQVRENMRVARIDAIGVAMEQFVRAFANLLQPGESIILSGVKLQEVARVIVEALDEG
jgi:hypothetical protein